MKYPTYRAWKNSRAFPNTELLPVICEFYQIPVSRLFVSENEISVPTTISLQEALNILQEFISSQNIKKRKQKIKKRALKKGSIVVKIIA